MKTISNFFSIKVYIYKKSLFLDNSIYYLCEKSYVKVLFIFYTYCTNFYANVSCKILFLCFGNAKFVTDRLDRKDNMKIKNFMVMPA